jgi:hypothetical protein
LVAAKQTCQIARGYRHGCPIPYSEDLQRISKEIQDGLELGFKPVFSSAAKHVAVLRHLIETLFSQLTRICAEVKSSKERRE